MSTSVHSLLSRTPELMNNRFFQRPLLLLFSLSALHCGSMREPERAAPPPPTEPPQPPPLQFETKTDTVLTHGAGNQGPTDIEDRGPQIRFMVQIGAFKDPQNASHIQTTARERFRMPVLNDYHPQLTLYQIRIGFFETYEAAQAFRLRLIKEHPKDYNDSWIVQLKR